MCGIKVSATAYEMEDEENSSARGSNSETISESSSDETHSDNTRVYQDSSSEQAHEERAQRGT